MKYFPFSTFRLILITAILSTLSPGTLQAQHVVRNSLASQGLPGIIGIPTATIVPSGNIDFNYNTKFDMNIRGSPDRPLFDRQYNFNFALGLLPRVMVTGRATVAYNTETETFEARDNSANVHFLLFDEGPRWPAVALGVRDLDGAAQTSHKFHSPYAVLSKTLFGRFRGTIGYGLGPDVLNGLFGGGELALNNIATLLGEYDTEDINVGIRLFPLPERLEAYGLPRPTVDLIWQDFEHISWGITFRLVLGEAKFRAQRAARAHKRYHRARTAPATEGSLLGTSTQLQQELIIRGMENVRVAVVPRAPGYAVIVEYENRRYNRDELHGLGLVLGLVALRTPARVTHMHVIVKEVNIPVLQLSTAISDYLAFLNDEISAWVYREKINITQHTSLLSQPLSSQTVTAVGNRSRLKLDLLLRPGIETRLLAESSVADMRFSVLPDAFMTPATGTVLNVRANVLAMQSSGFPGHLDTPVLDRILLHQALPLPLGRWASSVAGLTQLSVGRFSRTETGLANETVFTFLRGRLLLRGTFARVGSSFNSLDRWVALAEGRVRYTPWNLAMGITAGRFLDQDRGVVFDLNRFFGNTEIGLFLRHSNRGSLAGVRLALPLTVARELKPSRFRVRMPELFEYEHRIKVFSEHDFIRNDVARSLRTGHEIERVYWNRDRLYPSYILQHLEELREAPRRWINATN